jgi:hypothetical protein
MYPPSSDDEITGIVNYIDLQLSAIRAAAVGLTDAQVRLRPCRSALSIGGLIKHAAHGMQGAIARLTNPDAPPRALDEQAFVAYMAGFALTEDETALGVLAAFDEIRVAYLAAIAGIDPAATIIEPPAPWNGIFDARPANARYYLVHQIEEFARHAGHADIIREQIDGMAVPAIVLSQAGAPGNDYFQPYVPSPGTIGAA